MDWNEMGFYDVLRKFSNFQIFKNVKMQKCKNAILP
jgi:hypothetical protein